MAVVYENECCGCATSSYPCLGSECPNRHVPHLYCDKCEEDVEELYETENGKLCVDCILKQYEKVRIN